VTGESTQHRGVQPDIAMPTAISVDEVGESTRESALPWDRIRPVDFGKPTPLSAVVASLEQTHQRRIAEDPDFRALLAELENFERVRAQKTLSLNLKTRIAEREQMEQARLTRENARRTASGLKTITKITELAGVEPPDAVLAETTEIATDMSTGPLVLSSKLKDSPEPPTRQ
jgi:carboxyl-terminal processing protease